MSSRERFQHNPTEMVPVRPGAHSEIKDRTIYVITEVEKLHEEAMSRWSEFLKQVNGSNVINEQMASVFQIKQCDWWRTQLYKLLEIDESSEEVRETIEKLYPTDPT